MVFIKAGQGRLEKETTHILLFLKENDETSSDDDFLNRQHFFVIICLNALAKTIFT
jgi:hypothetical protein